MFTPNSQTDSDEESQIVYTFPRNEGEEVHFTLHKYRGRYYVDLRLWFQQEGETELKPTKKGISLAADRLPELKEGLNHLSAALTKVLEWEKKAPEKSPQKFPQKRREPQAWQKRQPG